MKKFFAFLLKIGVPQCTAATIIFTLSITISVALVAPFYDKEYDITETRIIWMFITLPPIGAAIIVGGIMTASELLQAWWVQRRIRHFPPLDMRHR